MMGMARSSGLYVTSCSSEKTRLLRRGFLLGLFFEPEDESNMFLLNTAYFETKRCYTPEERSI
jgi:hypothetical protein